MISESVIPFFVYKKNTKEAFFIVLNLPRDLKMNASGVNQDEQRVIQESKFAGSPRYVMGT